MTFDYSKYTAGNFVKFENVGDQVVGIIKDIREGKDYAGNPCPEIILEVNAEGDEKTVTAGQVRLKAALKETAPKVGDKVRIIYSGQTPNAQPGRAPAKEFTIDVQAGPHQLVSPGPADEAPF